MSQLNMTVTGRMVSPNHPFMHNLPLKPKPIRDAFTIILCIQMGEPVTVTELLSIAPKGAHIHFVRKWGELFDDMLIKYHSNSGVSLEEKKHFRKLIGTKPIKRKY